MIFALVFTLPAVTLALMAPRDTIKPTMLPPGNALGSANPITAASGRPTHNSPVPSTHAGEYFVRGERRLWCAIVLQQIQDARSTSPSLSLERHTARQWLTLSNQSFRLACDYAGLCPYEVAEKFNRIAADDEAPQSSWRRRAHRRPELPPRD